MTPERARQVLLGVESDACETMRVALTLRVALEMDPHCVEGPRLARRIARLVEDAESQRDEVVMVQAVVVKRPPWWRRWWALVVGR